jgi:hypothetical protein
MFNINYPQPNPTTPTTPAFPTQFPFGYYPSYLDTYALRPTALFDVNKVSQDEEKHPAIFDPDSPYLNKQL